MRIEIVGSEKIGGLVGILWSRAGHEVLFASRHPEKLDGLVQTAGNGARRGTPDEAIEFGEVILLSIPFVDLPEFGRTKRAALGQKVVLETANPYPERDGAMVEEVRRSGHGAGLYLREWLPGVRIVRAFNSVWDQTLARRAHCDGPRIGIPLASDDAEAMDLAVQLVRDAGFDPVVGDLSRARKFDYGTRF